MKSLDGRVAEAYGNVVSAHNKNTTTSRYRVVINSHTRTITYYFDTYSDAQTHAHRFAYIYTVLPDSTLIVDVP